MHEPIFEDERTECFNRVFYRIKREMLPPQIRHAFEKCIQKRTKKRYRFKGSALL